MIVHIPVWLMWGSPLLLILIGYAICHTLCDTDDFDLISPLLGLFTLAISIMLAVVAWLLIALFR